MAVALSPAPALEPTARRGPAVRLEGGLLGPDILERLQEGALPGQKPADFNLSAGRSLVEEIAAVFQDARDFYHVFRRGLDRLLENDPNDPATTLTRERWMIPFLGLLGYELRYNSRSYELGGQLFAISHRAGENEDAPPVHIVGARRSLDRVDPSGRPRVSPHALLQEFLNRSDHLWGIVTNGLELRLLRKSTLLRRQAYVAFDLEAIFEEERFIDFVLLYRLLHRTRLPKGIEDAPTCWLERYHEQAVEQGNRARDRLRDGVEKCLILLANGFLRHRPATESVRAEELYRDLLQLVYRFLFLLVTEERGLLSGNDLYREHYSITRLKRLVDRREAYTNHNDLWCGLRVLWHLLRDSTPVPPGRRQAPGDPPGPPRAGRRPLRTARPRELDHLQPRSPRGLPAPGLLLRRGDTHPAAGELRGPGRGGTRLGLREPAGQPPCHPGPSCRQDLRLRAGDGAQVYGLLLHPRRTCRRADSLGTRARHRRTACRGKANGEL